MTVAELPRPRNLPDLSEFLQGRIDVCPTVCTLTEARAVSARCRESRMSHSRAAS